MHLRSRLVVPLLALLILVSPGAGALLGALHDTTDDLLRDTTESINHVGPSQDPAPVPQRKIAMLDRLVRDMEQRWETLDDACSTDAPFQLVYLGMTREVRAHVAGGYFDDGAEVADFAVAFAERYFVAIDADNDGRWADVTDPWREAFSWGDTGRSTALEDALLGMNAHINYDLALVIEALDYAHPSNKPDYDRINDVLDAAAPGIVAGLETHYGVHLADGPIEGLTEPALVDLLTTWRENAWQNAKLLDASLTSLDHRLVLEAIETEAETIAQGFQIPKPSTEERRAAICAESP